MIKKSHQLMAGDAYLFPVRAYIAGKDEVPRAMGEHCPDKRLDLIPVMPSQHSFCPAWNAMAADPLHGCQDLRDVQRAGQCMVAAGGAPVDREREAPEESVLFERLQAGQGTPGEPAGEDSVGLSAPGHHLQHIQDLRMGKGIAAREVEGLCVILQEINV